MREKSFPDREKEKQMWLVTLSLTTSQIASEEEEACTTEESQLIGLKKLP